MVTAPQRGPAAKLPAAQCAIAAANIRTLRQRNGWTQAHLGQLMGWTAPSTVCAAEGRRGERQRRFARWEIDQLAAIFGIPATQLLTQCATCGGHPPPGYACLTCGTGHPPSHAHLAAARVSTRVDGATVTVTVSACAILAAGAARMTLTGREGPAPGIWQYNLRDGTDNRAGHGRITGKTDHLDVLRYAASICAAGYQPGTPERGLLEQFAAAAAAS